MGSTDEPNRFQHTRVLGVDDVVANTGEGGVAAMGRTAGWGCCIPVFGLELGVLLREVPVAPYCNTKSPQSYRATPQRDSTN